jgi:hypothetical protein
MSPTACSSEPWPEDRRAGRRKAVRHVRHQDRRRPTGEQLRDAIEAAADAADAMENELTPARTTF